MVSPGLNNLAPERQKIVLVLTVVMLLYQISALFHQLSL